jgi:hypothetical protein
LNQFVKWFNCLVQLTDQPPAWLVGRKKLSSELEFDFKTTPFETYSLMRGQVNGFLGSKIKTVGRLKGMIFMLRVYPVQQLTVIICRLGTCCGRSRTN